MNHRSHFFSVLEGRKPENIPFFPDITDWYNSKRTPKGEERRFGPAQFIPDDAPYHRIPGSMPAEFQDLTLMGFYERFDWGFPVHIENWRTVEYSGDVRLETKKEGGRRIRKFITPKGELTHLDLMSDDGTWGPVEHFVKSIGDLDILQYVVEHTHYTPNYEIISNIRRQMGERGFGDIVIKRSPFGKMVHLYMGFEAVAYALFDHEARVREFLKFQEEKDLEFLELVAAAPERLVIMSDHTDENLVSPAHYEEFCIPFYRKMNDRLHAAGKFVSTHLDGNIRGYLPLLKHTGFDLLDGCTPAPMFNYELEALAAAMPENMSAFVGVPSTLFCQHLPTERLLGFADRIMTAFAGRGILNIGDILPPDADIGQVVALGNYVRKSWGPVTGASQPL